MKIVALVENVSHCDLKPKHGICFYIETKRHKILFDLGPNKLFIINARKRGIDLTKVDTVIISHGHNDHAGGLKYFLEINNKAKIYIQEDAFKPHYTKSLFMIPIGVNPKYKDNKQIVLLNGDYKIDEELSLFKSRRIDKCYSTMNKCLYEGKVVDRFTHEHNLLIKENKDVLIMGCGHSGVVNIMESCPIFVDYAIGGFHLYNPVNKKSVEDTLMDEIAENLKRYRNTKFYTCHCTGEYAYNYLKNKMKLEYFSCGMELII